MADTKYIAVKNFYGPNGMERKGKEAIKNDKHIKKGLIITEEAWKKLQSEQKKASKIAANAKTTVLSQLASKEVQAVSKIVASQVEVQEAFAEKVEAAFTELGGLVEAQAKELTDQGAVITDLLSKLGNAVSVIDTLTAAAKVDTPANGPDEKPTGDPVETKVDTPVVTKSSRRNTPTS